MHWKPNMMLYVNQESIDFSIFIYSLVYKSQRLFPVEQIVIPNYVKDPPSD